jgi:hypothetical protein
MNSPFNRIQRNKTLYPNMIEVVTEQSDDLSKTNKSKIWVRRQDIDCSTTLRSKTKQKGRTADAIPCDDDCIEDEDSIELPSAKVELESKGVPHDEVGLDSPDKPTQQSEPEEPFVIIGFDTEYVSKKLKRLKTVDDAGKEKVIGWLKHDVGESENEICDETICIDPEKNPNWRHELAEKKQQLIKLNASNRGQDTTHKQAVRNHLLSYQFWARTNTGEEWNGICIPQIEQVQHKNKDGNNVTVPVIGRLKLADFILWALGTGKQQGVVKGKLPSKVYLVGHFTRADFCMFEDFQEISRFLGVIRNTFVTNAGINNYITVSYKNSYENKGSSGNRVG